MKPFNLNDAKLRDCKTGKFRASTRSHIPDPIIDRSPAQKLMRVDKLRAELADLGYSVVSTEWLHGIIDNARRQMEAAA
jgi:hypothetical protein